MATTVSSHDNTAMAISVLIRMTTLDRMLLTVPVTTTRMPATSFETRLWISPVRWEVKKAQGQGLQVGVKPVSEIAHHSLAHLLGEPGLQNAETARNHHH